MGDARLPGAVRPRFGFAIQVAGATRGGDRRTATTVDGAASTGAVEAEAHSGRPTALRLAVSAVSVDIECYHDHPARDCRALAPVGLSAVLALEITLPWRSAKGSSRDPAADPGDEPGQPAVGRPAHPW
jgi:hypothetical protein